LSHVLAMPTCTMFLADLGAEVIKIEPARGEDMRIYAPFINDTHGKTSSSIFLRFNRNKKSMVLDLRQEKGKEILRDLIVKSDVIVENFRPGTMKKMGFDWEALQKINPSIIYAAITGFGHDTLPEYSKRAAYDLVAQAYSGIMSVTGPVGGPSCRVGVSIGDMLAGHQAAIGILAALQYRTRTGRGQYLDCSMVDALFSILLAPVELYTMAGKIAGPVGSGSDILTPFQAFETKDSAVVITVANDPLWVKLCSILQREDLAGDPRFESNTKRTRNKAELIPMLEAEMKKKTTNQWCHLFEDAGIPYSPINTAKDICEDPHIRYRDMLVEIDQPTAGRCKTVGSSIRLSETPGEIYSPAPLLGEHSEEVLRDILGYTPQQVDSLRQQGVTNAEVQ